MEKFYNEVLLKLETAIDALQNSGECSIEKIEKIIRLIVGSLAEVKERVLQHGVKSPEEEINFFKFQKPVIVSKLIYFNAIYKIETRKPYGAKPIRKYLKKELKKMKRFFDENLDFYKYYRSNNTALNEKLFLRGKHDIKLWLDTYYLQSDQTFSTSQDYKVAKIMANDLVQCFIDDQLHSVNKLSLERFL